MKCIRRRIDEETDEVRRVSDETARRLTADGQWRYVPKKVWKRRQRKGRKPS